MRLIILQICGGIAALVFLAMLAAIAWHRVRSGSQEKQSPALAEYLWAIIPCLMIVMSAIPAARQIAASACESCDTPTVTRVIASASPALLSEAKVVIDEQQREQR